MQATGATSIKRFLVIPREHGAWGILLIPFFIGLSVAGRWNLPALLLLGAVLSLYLARYPLVLWARSGFDRFPRDGLLTFLPFSSLGLFLGALLIFKYGLWLLAALGAVGILFLLAHLGLVRHRKEMTEAGEFTGICALTLTAPAAFYISSGTMPEIAFTLWFLCVLYFGTSIFYVKMKVASRSPSAAPNHPNCSKLAWSLALYLTMALGSVAVLSYLRPVPALTFLAFVPLTMQATVGIFKPDRKWDIKRLGYTLVAHSIVYGLILVAVFRASSFGFPP